MTARFLLHLRQWEAKRDSLGTADKDIEGESIAFGSNPNAASRTAHSASYADEFGEDPVRRARKEISIDFSRSGGDMQVDIAEGSRV